MPEDEVTLRQIPVQQRAPTAYQTGWGLALFIKLGACVMMMHFIDEDSEAQRSPVWVSSCPSSLTTKESAYPRKPSGSILTGKLGLGRSG